MYFIEDDMGVWQLLHEEQLLDEDAISHIDDTALLLPKALHTNVIPYLRT